MLASEIAPDSPPPAASYRGRFAPSPTGPLHFGSLVAALGSCLDARSQGGEWLLRMEDVDGPRCVPGAADDILRTLEHYGFCWDGPLLWQSRRQAAYDEALDRLRRDGWAYGCDCTRREISAAATREAVDGGLVYPGTCRAKPARSGAPRAWRLLTLPEDSACDDRLQGRLAQCLEREVGDFVLRRSDGLYAYQLAVVVDDAFQGVTDVVRGADLIESTPRQIWLQTCLGLPTPRYAHLPVAVNAAGEKLSKQTRAPALEVRRAPSELVRALNFLGQTPPPELAAATVAEVWKWALAHWDFAAVPRRRTILSP